ncbi:hypothetical protein RB653_001336 [Dictyostelium firmibasis]|uniref:Uncharacterized protein n=1 Tax=Dictyostelium firmibasis TaxID=79012 RepID=A0AAN7U421_9MYCE
MNNKNKELIEKLKTKENEIKDLKETITSRDGEIENLKQEILSKNREIEDLTKKLNNYIGKIIPPENGITEYDMIIDIPSVDYFSKMGKSWMIYSSKSLKEKIQLGQGYNNERPLNSLIEEFQKYSTLACLGTFNKGKTFFINKYNDSYLPSGTRSQTIGLSLSISHSNETITIDTAGSNTALQVGENKSEEQLARKESTEMFIRDMAFSLASIVVYVLNELTWNDQRFIFALQSKIQSLRSEQNIRKTLIIVHNYQKVNSYEELLAEIKTYMDRPFNGVYHHGDIKKITSKEEVVLFFTESVNDTHHYFLCNDNSDFGKRYNELTIEKIRTYKNYNDNLDLDKVLLEGLQNNMVSYCKSPKKLKITKYIAEEFNIENNNPDEAENNLKVKTLFTPSSDEKSVLLKEVSDLYKKVSPHKSRITQTPVFTISPESDINRENDYKLIDNKVEFIGLQMVFSTGFKPMYDMVKIGDFLHYLIETPQMEMDEINCGENYVNGVRYLHVTGEKKLRINSDEPTDVYPNNRTTLITSQNQRREGQFELSIPIPNNYYPKNPDIKLSKGVLSITFKLVGRD